MKLLLLKICLIFLIMSCRIYEGEVFKKEIIPGYYTVKKERKYSQYSEVETYQETYKDNKGKTKTRPATRTVTRERYEGTTYKEIFNYPSYKITVRGWNKKEREIIETVFVSKEIYNSFDLKYDITLRTKADKWYKSDKEYFSFTNINPKEYTGREIYLEKYGYWGDRYTNDRDFETMHLPEWEKERAGDTYPLE